MSLKSIKNHPHRDGFDLSRKFAFTAKLGELLPVFVEDVMPGDSFKINADWFTRSQPVTSPAFTRFGEYYDFFFVPYHLLWRYFPQFIIQTDDDNWATGITQKSNKFTQHPYISSLELLKCIRESATPTSGENKLSNVFRDINGRAYSYGALKLLEYLGYGKTATGSYEVSDEGVSSQRLTYPLASVVSNVNKADIALNPFPLAAYQKVYQDFYRNTQWESPSPFAYNFDYLNGSNMKVPVPQTADATFFANGLCTLRYSNYNKDYFTGRLPEKQYGSEAIAAPLLNPDGSYPAFGGYTYYVSATNDGPANQARPFLIGKSSASSLRNETGAIESLAHAGIGALAIRQAEFLQKWKEITQSGGTDYVSQIEKHFGVKPNHEMAHRSTYIGGFDNKFGIDEVVNTNLAQLDSESSLAGKGINAGHGSINFNVKEHGIIIGIYHMSLLPEYSAQMTEKFMLKTMPTDYVIPEMDNVGMQSVSGREFAGALIPFIEARKEAMNRVLGYVPRYAEYKTHVDKVAGGFSSTLDYWVTPLNKLSARSIKDGETGSLLSDFFYKVDSKILNSVLAISVDDTVDTDQFLINCGFDVKAVRNISRDGLPY
ncbi:major capsid protein [Microvirus sp.]|nr:major capsid protein [Microvirus sp.]